jgi:hypothetical protein
MNYDIAARAYALTLLVEAYLRDDTGLPSVRESDLARAIYALRSQIGAAGFEWRHEGGGFLLNVEPEAA